MASVYQLPMSTIPDPFHKHTSSEHTFAHNHGHRKSRQSQNEHVGQQQHGASVSQNGDVHAHHHSHSHSHSHDHAESHYTTHSDRVPNPIRSDLKPVLNGHWRTGSSVGGKPLITPKHATFDAAGTYEPPAQIDEHPGYSVPRSNFTNMLLVYTSKWPLLHTIMTERDSRRILYFMSLNFSFMAVQAFYGYVTDSLGLLSDSIHMFFDCVALAVGLFAAIASKWPPSEKFPYGFGKIETLSGFANGVFLILISVEIMFEAFERIIEGRETKRLTELFIVSTLGLLVNLVGMAAFGHHHHGHDHGHSHANGHAHNCGGHSHPHSHENHDHGHAHDIHGHDEKHSLDHKHHSHSHSHSHDNENMYGIYLHVLADTLGSAAVIVSTILTHFWSWAGWDPIASFLIAVLILLSAMPLVKSSARRLLLTIPDDIEYSLRDTLSGISGIRGVAGYGVPKFWIDDRNTGSGGGGSGNKLLGVMHVVAVRGVDMEDVRDRVRDYLLAKGIDITLQVERDGESGCWCGIAARGGTNLSTQMAPPGSSVF